MSALDRTRPPQAGRLRDFDFPEVERRRLANGLDLRVGRLNRLPLVSVHLFLRGGEAALGRDAAGMAVLTASALEGGTRRRSGTELAEALERIGARFSTDAGWEGTSIELSCLADRLDEGLALLAEAVLEPDFPTSEVERARDQQLATIRHREMDPGALASDSALAAYFAPPVPYARRVDGLGAALEGVGRDALRGYADANYRPETGGLIVVGDVEPSEVEAMAADRFGAWSGAPGSVADFESTAATRERRVILVHRPGAVQSELRIGHVGAARSIADYYPLSLTNMVLGGMFSSRLNLNLRERNGFTYGVRSRFAFRSQAGPFQVSTAVGNDVTAPAISEIVSEVTRMAETGPEDAEVAAARDYAAGIFGLQLETVGQVSTRVSQLVVYGLPDDHFGHYREDVRGVGTAEAAEAARRHLRPDELQVVVVGDADEVGPAIDALGLGPLQVVQPEGPSTVS